MCRGRRVFVGRRAELDLLTLTHERVVRSGEPHLVAILGEPGVGKTTLVGELRERLGEGLDWHLGRCLAYGRAATYQPLAQILRRRYGLDDAEPEEAVLDRLGGHGILALTLGHEPDARLHPQEARRQLQEAWVELLNELADEGPTVVVVEDLHWAQDALLELLQRAARQATGPLLMLVTARPELVERSPLGPRARRMPHSCASSRSPARRRSECSPRWLGRYRTTCATWCSTAPRATPSSSRRRSRL